MSVYQVAETLGWSAERVREELSGTELCEWGVYLNSPFSNRSRDALMNGWLVHTIRSIVATKNKRPKMAESLFPFDKVYKGFFAVPKAPAKSAVKAGGKKLLTTGEVAYASQVLRTKYEKALAVFRAGKRPNRFGLMRGERMG